MPAIGDSKLDGDPLCGRRVRVIKEITLGWWLERDAAPLREGQLGTIMMFCTSEFNQDRLGYVHRDGSWMSGIEWDGRKHPLAPGRFCGLGVVSEKRLRELGIELLSKEE